MSTAITIGSKTLQLPDPGESYSVALVNQNNQNIADEVNKIPFAKGQKPFGHMGRTAGFQTMSGGGTVVIMDAAQDLRGGMTFDNASDSLVIPVAGRYRITIKGMATGAAGTGCGVKAQVNLTDISGAYCNMYKPDTADYHFGISLVKSFNAGDKVNLINMSNVSTWGTNGYDGTWLELEWSDS